MVEPYNPYRFSWQFVYAPTIPGLNSNTREMVDLSTCLEFWRTGILSRARQTVTFPCSTSPHTPPAGYRTWLNKLFPSEAPRSSYVKHGKWKSLPTSVHPSILVFQPSGSSKRKHSSSSIVEDRGPKNARGVRKDASSSSGSNVASPVRRSPEGVTPSAVPDSVVEVSSYFSSQEHTELVDTVESTKCLAIEGKSLETVLKEEESAIDTFKVLSQMSLVSSPAGTSETLQKISLLRVTFEDHSLKTRDET
ncbi:hypothetical protein LIER_32550 [Lithospermum erythrorhizon]|uniref:Uncharacterized protein n=1 Tax=Lithospermum erythrorhizon TaxID=34254 RepID=A0AAV3RY16_LITER